jgi:hypothetical protein
MINYRYVMEVHILPAFGGRELSSLTAEEIAAWGLRFPSNGLSRRTARDARSTFDADGNNIEAVCHDPA